MSALFAAVVVGDIATNLYDQDATVLVRMELRVSPVCTREVLLVFVGRLQFNLFQRSLPTSSSSSIQYKLYSTCVSQRLNWSVYSIFNGLPTHQEMIINAMRGSSKGNGIFRGSIKFTLLTLNLVGSFRSDDDPLKMR